MVWQIVRGVEISKGGLTLFRAVYMSKIYVQCYSHWHIEINIEFTYRIHFVNNPHVYLSSVSSDGKD